MFFMSLQSHRRAVKFSWTDERIMNGLQRIRILVAEGDGPLRAALHSVLVQAGYRVESCADGVRAQAWARSGFFHLLVIDPMLPVRDGYEVCRVLRKNAVNTPVLMLGPLEIKHKLAGFKAGADDYLSKPFELLEFEIRVEALLRRVYRHARQELKFVELNGAQIDFTKATVFRNGKKTVLRKRECELLRYLVEEEGRVFSRDELLQAIWGYSSIARTRIVDVHVARLRQKIEPDPKNPEYIITVHGEGYRFAH